MNVLKIKNGEQEINVETNTGVYLAYKADGIVIINGDIVDKRIKQNNSYLLKELGKYVEADRLEFTDISSDYTILSDEDGLSEENTFYAYQYADDLNGMIPGDFIVARLTASGNAIPLNEADVTELQEKLKIRLHVNKNQRNKIAQ